MITATTRATPAMLWARAALVAVVVVAVSVVGHASAEGLLPGPVAMLALVAATTVVAARFLTRQASPLRLVGLLVAGQVAIHGVLTLVAGHASDLVTSAGHGGGAGTLLGRGGFVFDGTRTDRAGSYFDQVAAMQPTVEAATRSATHAGVGAGSPAGLLDGPAHLVDHLAAQNLAMVLAHLLVVALLGLWLAVGERALWTVLTLTTSRLVGVVTAAVSVLLVTWAAVLLERVRRAPSLPGTGHDVVPLPRLLDHVVAHRGPPALLAA